MRFLIFGDSHLKGAGETPNYDSVKIPSETDAIITLGDTVHQIRPADVAAGRKFYSKIAEDTNPVFAVPGNHDPVGEHHRLLPDDDSIKLIHDCIVSVGDIDILGWGCDDTQFSPAIRCIEFEALDPRGATDNRRFAADSAADRLEDSCYAHIVEGVDERTIADRLDIRDSEFKNFVEGLALLRERYQRLSELAEAATPPIVVASHIPPYGTNVDRHHSVGQREADLDSLHLGSIALKLVLREYTPAVSISGHSHSQGYEILNTARGTAHVLNLGFQGIGSLSLDDTGAGFSYNIYS